MKNMLSLFRFLFDMFTVVSIFFTSIFSPAVISPVSENFSFSFLEYPKEAVKTLEEWGVSEEQIKARADAGQVLYADAQGYSDVNGLIVSPYYTARINEADIPVYSATVFLGSTQKGELHSFSEVYIEKGSEFSFNIELFSKKLEIKNATVLPESLNTKARCGNGIMTASIKDFGIYTFLFNGANQSCAYTLFVRERVNEEKEIEAFINEYGEENVTVFEKGVHLLDYISNTSDNKILYLKQGAYLIAKHNYDIKSEADEALYIEDGAISSNSIGLTRYPFINFYNCKNVKVVGYGAVDLTRLDRRERRGVVFNFCENIEVRGIKIINSPEWSFITYQCDKIRVDAVDIFGYRQNSDAFAICNSRDVTVESCFARSGDDLFDVKTLGGSGRCDSSNVVFRNCVAWGGKARCFGICGEVNREIKNILFTDCAVIYRDATWDSDRLASLAVIVEQGDGSISDVTFQNIEIFRDDGRAICCTIYEDGIENFSAENIVFKNISYVSFLPSKISSDKGSGNGIGVTVEDVFFGKINVEIFKSFFFETDSSAQINFK